MASTNFVAFFRQEFLDFCHVVTLYQDDTVFRRTAATAFCLEFFLQSREVSLFSYETFDQRNGFTLSSRPLKIYVELLLTVGQSFDLFGFIVSLITKVGIGRKDHAQARFPIIIHLFRL